MSFLLNFSQKRKMNTDSRPTIIINDKSIQEQNKLSFDHEIMYEIEQNMMRHRNQQVMARPVQMTRVINAASWDLSKFRL